jgi:hypothetical protein
MAKTRPSLGDGGVVATRCALENQNPWSAQGLRLFLGKAGAQRFEVRLRELLAAEPRPASS